METEALSLLLLKGSGSRAGEELLQGEVEVTPSTISTISIT